MIGTKIGEPANMKSRLTTIPHKLTQQLYLQYHCWFVQESRFYFTIFNQMQCHSVSRAIVPWVKNSKQAILEFMAIISECTCQNSLCHHCCYKFYEHMTIEPTTMQPLLTACLLPGAIAHYSNRYADVRVPSPYHAPTSETQWVMS